MQKTDRPLFKTRAYALGVVAVLGSEFVLRDVLLPQRASRRRSG